MAEGSQHGGHPIVKSIEEKLRAAITVEHFVCHLTSSLTSDRVIRSYADDTGDSGYIRKLRRIIFCRCGLTGL
jgi:hypothetical protein